MASDVSINGEISVDLRDRALEYLQRLEQVAHLLDDEPVETSGDRRETIIENSDSQSHVSRTGSEYTLIVVDDFSLKWPGSPRLFEYFMVISRHNYSEA